MNKRINFQVLEINSRKEGLSNFLNVAFILDNTFFISEW